MNIDQIVIGVCIIVGMCMGTLAAQSPIEIKVGKGKTLEVVIPDVKIEDVRSIVVTFLSRSDQKAKAALNKLLTESPQITLTIKSEIKP